MRIGLDHIHVFASDVAKTLDFFCRMFDARCVWDEQAAGARNVRIALGNAFIHLYDRPLKGPRSGPVHHIGIETDDLEARVSRMCAQGFVFRNPIRREPKFNYVMVMGPDDLLIELFQCHEPERWQVQRSGPDKAASGQVRVPTLTTGSPHSCLSILWLQRPLWIRQIANLYDRIRPHSGHSNSPSNDCSKSRTATHQKCSNACNHFERAVRPISSDGH